MQEEITKHTKKIYKLLGNSTHSLREKAQEIVIEIFIIVFAVTLSIWLHSWSEHRHQQEDVHRFLVDLKEDIENDMEILGENKEIASKLSHNYALIKSLKKEQSSDDYIGPLTDFQLLNANFNDGIYEGFKSSGKIGTIENNELKKLILRYYQQTIPNLTSHIDFVNPEQLKLLEALRNEKGNLSNYEFYTSQKMQSVYHNLEFNLRNAIANFDNAIKQGNEIVAQIGNTTNE